MCLGRESILLASVIQQLFAKPPLPGPFFKINKTLFFFCAHKSSVFSALIAKTIILSSVWRIIDSSESAWNCHLSLMRTF